METNKKQNRFNIVLTVICVFMVLLAVVTVVANKSKRQHIQPKGTQKESAAPGISAELTGVVVQRDQDKEKLVLRQVDSNLETTLYYDNQSQLENKYKEKITGDQIQVGEILQVEYQRRDNVITTSTVPETVWEYNEVDRFTFRTAENMMKFAGKKYQYSGNTWIASAAGGQKEAETIEMVELSDKDRLTVRGIGFKVYSIMRTASHGYIRLVHYDDFMSGMVEVGNSIIMPISENMLITVPEGIHRLTLCKGAAVTSKIVTVAAGQEVTVDFSDYVSVVENVGMITFHIAPDGADLTINGTKVDYSQPVALNYGEYTVEVSMNGYDTYIGTLDVEDASRDVYIDLIASEASVEGSATATPAASATPTGSADTESDKDESSVTKKIDSDHTITVSAPRGVEVYVDNVYKGLAPCKFTKIIGSQTVTLRKEGYVTKSYSVDILDDEEDVTLKFDELVAESKD